MEPLYDNLRFIKSQSDNHAFQADIDKMLEEDNLIIAPLAYIRGRSISQVCFIVDEAQNLTPHELKLSLLVLVKVLRLFLQETFVRLIHLI